MDLRKYSVARLFKGKKNRFVKNQAKASIEAEEIFLDAEAVRSIEDKGKLEKPIKAGNFFVFYGLIVVCLLTLFLRAGYLQVVKGQYYQELAQGNSLRVYPISAPRGIIYDRNGQPLVRNIIRFDLVVDMIDFLNNQQEKQNEILNKIADIVAEQPTEKDILNQASSYQEEINETKKETSRFVLIKGVERSDALILEALVGNWPGLRLEKNPQREYLDGPYFAHILGYTGQVDKEDLEANPDYYFNDQIGKAGLEAQYEAFLRGQPGHEQIEVNSKGETQKIIAVKTPQAGESLVLSIDKDLQIKLTQELEEMLDSLSSSGARLRKAAAAAVDPKNGGVLAMVSLPSYDNNLFAGYISPERLASLEKDTSNPFLNRVVAGQYPSGSTIKPLIGSAALMENIVTPYQQVNCLGAIYVPSQYDPNITYVFPDWDVHGPTDLIMGIARSCNVYFYALGGGYGSIDGLGIERIKKYLKMFGLGKLTGVDLPHEEAGLVPDPAWKEAVKGEKWYLGDTYHTSIGQGDILATPLQINMAISSIANNGVLYQPQIVDRIINSGGKSIFGEKKEKIVKDIVPSIANENFIKLEHLRAIQKGMRQAAVMGGTGWALSSVPVKVAGKTGTAQFGDKTKTHAWFSSYAPYQDPEIVLTVMVEAGGEGYEAAVPVAGQTLEWYFNQETKDNQ